MIARINLFSEVSFHKIKGFHSGSYATWIRPVKNHVAKRGSMLKDMLKDRDKRKHWHFEILQSNAKSKNVFEKVSKPSRRQNVLNSLFIRNISDVMSTTDVAPEVLGCGIELTGVKISPCCKILNVYWQTSFTNASSDVDIGTVLNKNAHKIRAELISRNVMGRVPHIFFLRDMTNANLAAFEKALKEVEAEQRIESSNVVPDDTFVLKKKKFFSFTDSKPVKEQDPVERVTKPAENISVKSTEAPPKPIDMRSDIFGLKHDVLMNKVNFLKTRVKIPEHTNVIFTPDGSDGQDLFSQIPGTTIHSDSNRDELLKHFYAEKRKLIQEKMNNSRHENESLICESFEEEENDVETFVGDEDYVEEDTPERF